MFFSSWFVRSSFSDYAQKHGKDARFKSIEKMRDRESLFNEFIQQIRKAAKEESSLKAEKVIIQMSEAFRLFLCLVLKYARLGQSRRSWPGFVKINK